MNTRMRGSGAGHGERIMSAMSSMANLTFRRQEVPAVRGFARAFGARAGMGAARLTDFALAVSEAAACAICRRQGAARMRLWTTEERVLCEIRVDGLLVAEGPRALEQGDTDAVRRHVLRLICDYVSVEVGQVGVTVSFSMTVA